MCVAGHYGAYRSMALKGPQMKPILAFSLIMALGCSGVMRSPTPTAATPPEYSSRVLIFDVATGAKSGLKGAQVSGELC